MKHAAVVGINSSADPTATNYVSGMIYTNAGASGTWTLPTGVALADAMSGATVAIDDSFECAIINVSGGNVTFENASGCFLRNISDAIIGNVEIGILRFVFADATTDNEVYIVMLINP